VDLTLRKLGKTEKKRLKEYIYKHTNEIVHVAESSDPKWTMVNDLCRFNGLNPYNHFNIPSLRYKSRKG